MNTKRLAKMVSHYIAPVSAPPHAAAKSALRAGRSGSTVLLGWLVSMIGIVLYFFVMSSGDQQADLLTALIAQGPLGWSSLLIILIGIGLWFVGCIGLLQEAEDATLADE